MKVRHSKFVSIDNVQLIIARGITLHPALYRELLSELEHLERKGKISLVPSTILELYNIKMQRRVADFEESCRLRNIVLSSYLV